MWGTRRLAVFDPLIPMKFVKIDGLHCFSRQWRDRRCVMPRSRLDSYDHIEELSDPRENREESIPVVVAVIISIVVVPMMVPGPSIFVRVTIMAVAVSIVNSKVRLAGIRG
jgi:hypothetical protein